MLITEWPLLRWGVAVVGLAVTALVIGIPTGIIRTSLYTRMTPVLWWNYPVWALTAVLSGLIFASYVRTRDTANRPRQLGIGGSVLSLLAVGCPVCNKLVVMLVGVSGAMSIWSPLQPLIALSSLALLGWALRQRLRGERACPSQLPAAG